MLDCDSSPLGPSTFLLPLPYLHLLHCLCDCQIVCLATKYPGCEISLLGHSLPSSSSPCDYNVIITSSMTQDDQLKSRQSLSSQEATCHLAQQHNMGGNSECLRMNWPVSWIYVFLSIEVISNPTDPETTVFP